MSKPVVIHVNQLHFRYKDNADDVLHIDDLKINEGEHVFIQGASGSGKTSLLNVIAGINQPYKGEIKVLDQSLPTMSSRKCDQFRVDYMGIIFQQFNLLPFLSVLDNVQLPCWFSERRKKLAGNNPNDIKQTALRLLNGLSLPESIFNQPANSLSVGQQQRVAVARALIGQPKLIIADEPTSALDSANRANFLELLFLEANKQNSTIVYVSHDENIASYFSRVVNLTDNNLASVKAY